MSPPLLILGYCVLTVLASWIGGWLPSLIRLTHVRKQMIMSLVSGVMLGVASLHMLPLAVENFQSVSWVGGSMLCGVLMMFFLLRVFHVHAHDSTADPHEHDHDHQHEQHLHEGQPKEPSGPAHQFSWVGLLVGLTIHSMLDGVALAASVAAEGSHSHAQIALLSFGTFLAVFLHKPLDALAIMSLMRTAECSSGTRTVVNFLFAWTCPLGALLFWLGASHLVTGQAGQNALVGCALAFSAGFFLCIALSDLLPEVAFHSHDRVKLSAALLVGVALAIGIEMLHSHDHGDHDGQTPHEGHDHSHSHEH